MQCLVLAGGLASRMRPTTELIPKSLIPIGEVPFLSYQLAWLARTGVDDVVLSIGYRGEAIREYVGNGEKWNLRVSYVDEGKNLRGTGGAVRLAVDEGHMDERFLLTYGDSFLPVDFGAIGEHFRRDGSPAMMTVFFNEGRWDKSNVWFEQGRVRLYDKYGRHPEAAAQLRYIDFGLLAVERAAVVDEIPAGERYDLAEFLYGLSREGRLAGLEVKQRFYEIGSPAGLDDFRQWVKNGELAKLEKESVG